MLKADGEAHYMRGGKPGYFPTFDNLPHPAPFNLFDPFKLSKNASPEKKAKGLLAEVNNGRLAMCAATEHTTLRRALASPIPPVACPRPGIPHLRVESMRPAAPAPEPLFLARVLAPMRSPCMELISARPLWPHRRIGLFGFLAESQVPGSVPGLSSVGLKAYSGNIMAPFDANFHIF